MIAHEHEKLDLFSEFVSTSYKTNEPAKVRLPVLPSEFRNQKPVIDHERSGTILDGYVTIQERAEI